jgi:CBS domain-containing protein
MQESAIDGADAPVSSLLRRAPVWCGPATPVAAVLQTMREQRIGSMIVANESAVPLGIFTLRDVLDRVTLDAGAMQAPIADHMSPRPVTAEIDSGAYQVALTMIRHGVNHVVLVRDGRLAGLVSARDLFGLQSATLRQLSTAIRSARDLAQIEAYGRDIAELARKMLAQGVATGPLSAFIASLNDLLTQRIVEIEFHGIDARYCWILMGSEGRSEQTLVTDQDNGLIFAPAAGVSPEDTRPKLLAICQRVNHALDRAGYQLCPGDIMAGNPQWCLTLDEWQVKFGRWIDSGSPDALLHGSIFFDLRPLQGDLALAQQLRQWLIQHAARNPRFLHQMAANALRNRPPLGVLRDFRLDGDGMIDLKLNGTMPFVDAARIYSLAHAIDECNTARRLFALARTLKIPGREVAAWIAAYQHIQGHRLRCQGEALAQNRSAGNRIDPETLNAFDREVLRQAFRQAVRLQERLALDYQV